MMMDMYDFYTGKAFNAYEYLGAHISGDEVSFRVFAPNAEKVCVVGDLTQWKEIEMDKVYDGNFYECNLCRAKEGIRYKYRVYKTDGSYIDHSDPYGYGTELRPQNCSIVRDLYSYKFSDSEWLKTRTDGKDRPVNIYEIHIGSWKIKTGEENSWYRYDELAKLLIPYLKDNHYTHVEIMPICEYPCDESWGYQALGYYSPTSRYGTLNDLKRFIDLCHQNKIGVILDFVPVHFAVNDYGLAEFDGSPLYEYPHKDIAYNEWGSKNFAFSRGEIRSFLQSSIMYWIKEYHFDGIRFDAISNMIYWQGNKDRGENGPAISFLKYMNEEIKKAYPDIMLIAEDSSAFPKVTGPASEDGLGFDYKWDMGWMNDTLEYFKEDTACRIRDYHKLTFSMHYFYSEHFLMPFSHDEVVHGKATVLQKMNGEYDDKFPQLRALYLYMYAHPGKILNFMGNEFGQLREWDEKREQDWDMLRYPKHDSFKKYIQELNKIYVSYSAMYELDYEREGFVWLDCQNKGTATYAFIRKGKEQSILAVFNFGNKNISEYAFDTDGYEKASIILDSDWEQFGGTRKQCNEVVLPLNDKFVVEMGRFSGKLYLITKNRSIMSLF